MSYEAPPSSERRLRERIKILERSCTTGLTAYEKMHLLSVMKGVKPATLIYIDRSYDEFDEDESYEDAVRPTDEVRALVRDLSLPVRIVEQTTDYDDEDNGSGRITLMYFCVGKDEPSAERLAAALSYEDVSPEAHERAMGLALGFPVTATDAFVKHQALSAQAVPEDIKQQEVWPFVEYALSREHCHEELELARQEMETVKALSPTICRQVIETYKKVQIARGLVKK